MTRRTICAVLMLVFGLAVYGVQWLTADEPGGVPRQRVSPKLLKEAAEHPVITATVPHTLGRNIQDLRTFADDLEKSGLKSESARLKSIVKEFVRHAEHDLADKKAQLARLNAEVDELKSVAVQ